MNNVTKLNVLRTTAHEYFGDGDKYKNLLTIANTLQRAAEARNDIIHSKWLPDNNENLVIKGKITITKKYNPKLERVSPNDIREGAAEISEAGLDLAHFLRILESEHNSSPDKPK